MDFSFSDLNFNSVENLPGFEAREAFVDALFNQNYTMGANGHVFL